MGLFFSKRKRVVAPEPELQQEIAPIVPIVSIEPEVPAAKSTPEKVVEEPAPLVTELSPESTPPLDAPLIVEDVEDVVEVVRAPSPEKELPTEPSTPPVVEEVVMMTPKPTPPPPVEPVVEQCDPTHIKDETGLEFKEAGPDTTLNDLFTACKMGDVDKVMSILDGEGDENKAVELQNARGMWGSTLLMVAIQYKHLTLAKHLLERDKVDTRAVNEKGATALLYACVDNHNNIVRTIIEYEAEGRSWKPEVEEMGATPATGPYDHRAGFMCQSARLYNELYDSSGMWTPLAVACANGNLELFVILLETSQGGCSQWINRNFDFPVMMPLQESKMGEVIGVTPLMIICAYGHTEFLHSVMDDDAYNILLDFQQLDEEGASAVHHAARGRDPKGIFKLILQEESLSAEALARVHTASMKRNNPPHGNGNGNDRSKNSNSGDEGGDTHCGGRRVSIEGRKITQMMLVRLSHLLFDCCPDLP